MPAQTHNRRMVLWAFLRPPGSPPRHGDSLLVHLKSLPCGCSLSKSYSKTRSEPGRQLLLTSSGCLSGRTAQLLSDTCRETKLLSHSRTQHSSQKGCAAQRGHSAGAFRALFACLFSTCFLQNPFHANVADLSAPVIPSPRATRKVKPISTSLL